MRILFGIIFLILVLALAACSYIARRSGKEMGQAASILTACLILPLAGNGILLVSSSRGLSLAGCYIYYLGLDVSIAAMIHFSFEYCRMRPRNRIRNSLYALLTVDVVQLLLNPLFHHAFEVSPIEVDGFDYYTMTPLIGQRFHRAVDYLLLACIVVTFVIRVFRTPRLQRERYTVILGALIFVTVWETVYIAMGEPIDRSMVGIGIFGLLVFYFSLYYRPMRLLDRMLSSVVSEKLQPMYVFDEQQNCLWMNQAGQKFLHLREDETDKAGNALEAFFGSRHPGEEEWKDAITMVIDGETRYLELAKVPQRDTGSKLNGFYIYVRDLTDERRDMERKLYNARHDGRTGLFNRDYLYARTRELLAAHPGETYLAVYAEITDLKLINDLYGNSFGDEALRLMAREILDYIPENGVCGRLSGDSFGACVPEEGFDQLLLEEALNRAEVCEGETRYHPLVHAGIYRITDRNLEASVIYDRAQLAVDTVRDGYYTCTAWYDEAMRDLAVRNRQYSEELKEAISQGQIRPWLQPIVDRDGKTIGAEALVRWIHPQEGMRMPGSFIPLFEKNGMIADLDLCIWRQCCEILARWQQEGKDLFLSVNISPRDFYLVDVVEILRSLVKEYGIDPGKLRLELTESVMIHDREKRMQILRDLQGSGFVVEMDDFGSGYSSLNLLREMPVDVLKIDMAFIRKTANNARAQTIVRQVVSLAKELGMVSLTEGVETKEQFDSLAEVGCQLYQGYYFARQMPAEEFERQLEENRAQGT